MTATAPKTLDAILAAEEAARREYEANTVAACVDGKPVTVAELRAAFEKVENPADWKRPVSAVVDAEVVALTVEAVKFFQGDDPAVMPAAKFPGLYRVVSKGYQG